MCVFLFHVFLLHIFIIYFLYIYLYSSNAQIAKLTTRASEKKISHLWNIYSNEKDKKKLEKNYNYYDKFPGKSNRETHMWTSNIGYCIQAKLHSRYKV